MAGIFIRLLKLLRNPYLQRLLIVIVLAACVLLQQGGVASYFLLHPLDERGFASYFFQIRVLSQSLFVLVIVGEADRIEDFEGGIGIRAAGYVRVSTRRQARDGFSLAAQEQELRKLAQDLKFSRVYWFIDTKTGKDFDRRKLSNILDMAEAHAIQSLLIVRIDRVGRLSRCLLTFFFELRDYDVTINTPEGGIDVGGGCG